MPDGAGPAVENVQISTHNGTHLDAPYHFHPTMDGGKPAMTIDEVPLEWCFNDAVKLDFRSKADGYVCTADDVKRELDRLKYQLKPLDIVLVNTSAGKAYGQPNFLDTGCGMGREATLFLLKQGIRVTGTNAWSWDAPFSYTAKRYKETGDASIIWEGHKAGREIGYCHMEKLVEPRRAARPRLQGRVLSGEDRARISGLDARGGDHRLGGPEDAGYTNPTGETHGLIVRRLRSSRRLRRAAARLL